MKFGTFRTVALLGLFTFLPVSHLLGGTPPGKCCPTCDGACGSSIYYRKCHFGGSPTHHGSEPRSKNDSSRSGGLASRVPPTPTGMIVPYMPIMPFMPLPYATPVGYQSRSGGDDYRSEYRGESRGPTRIEQIEQELDEIRAAFTRLETLIRGQQQVMEVLTEKVKGIEKQPSPAENQ